MGAEVIGQLLTAGVGLANPALVEEFAQLCQKPGSITTRDNQPFTCKSKEHQ